MEGEAPHFVGEIGERDLGLGAIDVDSAHKQPHLVLLMREHMSTRARMLDYATLAYTVRSCTGLPLGFLRWI